MSGIIQRIPALLWRFDAVVILPCQRIGRLPVVVAVNLIIRDGELRAELVQPPLIKLRALAEIEEQIDGVLFAESALQHLTHRVFRRGEHDAQKQKHSLYAVAELERGNAVFRNCGDVDLLKLLVVEGDLALAFELLDLDEILVHRLITGRLGHGQRALIAELKILCGVDDLSGADKRGEELRVFQHELRAERAAPALAEDNDAILPDALANVFRDLACVFDHALHRNGLLHFLRIRLEPRFAGGALVPVDDGEMLFPFLLVEMCQIDHRPARRGGRTGSDCRGLRRGSESTAGCHRS